MTQIGADPPHAPKFIWLLHGHPSRQELTEGIGDAINVVMSRQLSQEIPGEPKIEGQIALS